MKSIRYYFRNHMGMYYAFVIFSLACIALPLIGVVLFELSNSMIVPLFLREFVADTGAAIVAFSAPISIVLILIFRRK